MTAARRLRAVVAAVAGLVAAAAVPTAVPAGPYILQGPATPVGGIGLRLAGETVDLFGITLPDAAVDIGLDARDALSDATRGEVASCAVVPASPRPLARCAVAERDLALLLLERGLAYVDPARTGGTAIGDRYLDAADAARDAGLGLWSRPAAGAAPAALPSAGTPEGLLAPGAAWGLPAAIVGGGALAALAGLAAAVGAILFRRRRDRRAVCSLVATELLGRRRAVATIADMNPFGQAPKVRSAIARLGVLDHGYRSALPGLSLLPRDLRTRISAHYAACAAAAAMLALEQAGRRAGQPRDSAVADAFGDVVATLPELDAAIDALERLGAAARPAAPDDPAVSPAGPDAIDAAAPRPAAAAR